MVTLMDKFGERIRLEIINLIGTLVFSVFVSVVIIPLVIALICTSCALMGLCTVNFPFTEEVQFKIISNCFVFGIIIGAVFWWYGGLNRFGYYW